MAHNHVRAAGAAGMVAEPAGIYPTNWQETAAELVQQEPTSIWRARVGKKNHGYTGRQVAGRYIRRVARPREMIQAVVAGETKRRR